MIQNMPEEFRTHWRVLLGSFFGISVGYASIYFYSYGIFIKPLAEEFDWGRGEASLAALLGTLSAALIAAPVGRLVDRFGPIKVALISLSTLSLSFFLLGSLTSGLISFVVITIFLSVLAAGTTAIPYSQLIVSHFSQQRGLALGIAFSGAGIGAMLVPLFLAPFVALHGWRAGYFALAITVILSMPLLWLLLRSSNTTRVQTNRQPQTPLTIAQMFSNKIFVRLGIAFFFASLAILGAIVHFYPLLTDLGFSVTRAGLITSLIGVSAIFGRLIIGFLVDRLAPLLVTTVIFLIAASGFFLILVGELTLAIPAALITGFALGAETDLLAFLVGKYLPKKSYGQSYGALYGLVLIGGALGPVLYGLLFDFTGSYANSLMISTGLLLVSSFTILSIKQVATDAVVPSSEQSCY